MSRSLRRAALAAAALACAGAARAAWWPFGEASDGKIAPVQKISDAGRDQDVLAALSPQFMQTLRGADLRGAYILRGESLERLGRPDEALGDYQVGAGLFPKSAELLTLEGALLHRNGLDEHARELFLRALQYDPQSSRAHLGLAEIENRLGFLDRAATHYEGALELLAGRADVWRDYAQVLLALNEVATADLALHKALELEPRSSDAHVLLAFSRRAQGDYDEALLQLDQAVDLGAGVGALRAKALWLLEAGRLPAASAAADAVLRAAPGDAAAVWVKARLALPQNPPRAAALLAPLADSEGDESPSFSTRAARALRDAALAAARSREERIYDK
jgi:tetratricopeptide (TPR) repeat protein